VKYVMYTCRRRLHVYGHICPYSSSEVVIKNVPNLSTNLPLLGIFVTNFDPFERFTKLTVAADIILPTGWTDCQGLHLLATSYLHAYPLCTAVELLVRLPRLG